jgi:hypothetical protein
MIGKTIITYETTTLGAVVLRVEHYPDENRVFIETFTSAGVTMGKVEVAALITSVQLIDIFQQIAETQRETNEKNG